MIDNKSSSVAQEKVSLLPSDEGILRRRLVVPVLVRPCGVQHVGWQPGCPLPLSNPPSRSDHPESVSQLPCDPARGREGARWAPRSSDAFIGVPVATT